MSSDQFFKTKMCPDLARAGMCSRAERCRFAHSAEELRSPPNLHKTKMCPRWLRGACPLVVEACPFAHGESDLRGTDDYYKTDLCKFWRRGLCTAGPSCRHAHGEEEIREKRYRHTELEKRALRESADLEALIVQRRREWARLKRRIAKTAGLPAGLRAPFINFRAPLPDLIEATAQVGQQVREGVDLDAAGSDQASDPGCDDGVSSCQGLSGPLSVGGLGEAPGLAEADRITRMVAELLAKKDGQREGTACGDMTCRDSTSASVCGAPPTESFSRRTTFATLADNEATPPAASVGVLRGVSDLTVARPPSVADLQDLPDSPRHSDVMAGDTWHDSDMSSKPILPAPTSTQHEETSPPPTAPTTPAVSNAPTTLPLSLSLSLPLTVRARPLCHERDLPGPFREPPMRDPSAPLGQHTPPQGNSRRLPRRKQPDPTHSGGWQQHEGLHGKHQPPPPPPPPSCASHGHGRWYPEPPAPPAEPATYSSEGSLSQQHEGGDECYAMPEHAVYMPFDSSMAVAATAPGSLGMMAGGQVVVLPWHWQVAAAFHTMLAQQNAMQQQQQSQHNSQHTPHLKQRWQAAGEYASPSVTTVSLHESNTLRGSMQVVPVALVQQLRSVPAEVLMACAPDRYED